MLRHLVHSSVVRLSALGADFDWQTPLTAAGCAAALSLLALQWIVSWGTSAQVTALLLICATLGLVVGRRLPVPRQPSQAARARLAAVTALAAWCGLSPLILAAIQGRLLNPDWLQLDSPTIVWTLLGLGCAALIVPAALLTSWLCFACRPGAKGNAGDSLALGGAALGLIGWSLLFSQWVGPYAAVMTGLTAAWLGCGWKCRRALSLAELSLD